jgi:hypothetical protein
VTRPLRRAYLLIRLHGVISPEVAGRFTGLKFGPAQLYAAETEAPSTPHNRVRPENS